MKTFEFINNWKHFQQIEFLSIFWDKEIKFIAIIFFNFEIIFNY